MSIYHNNFIANLAKDFTTSAVMPDNSINDKFNLKDYANKRNCIIFFYPLAFTFVCPSEIISINNKIEQFKKSNSVVLTVSVDSSFTNLAWKKSLIQEIGIKNIEYPMASDLDKSISSNYDVLNKDGIDFRATFIIDDTFTIRHLSINDLPIGRDIDEALRIIDAINYNKEHGDLCPAGWKKGKPSMKASGEATKVFLQKNQSSL